MVLPVGSTVVAGKYELLEEIGRGGMGSIWRARSRSLEMDCALKMVLPHHVLDGAHQMRLFREARAAAKLHSPYVVTIYDVGQWEGGAFIAMELLEGQSLKKQLEQTRILPTTEVLEIVRQIALGLDKAHSAGLVHRDLKPDNIFIVQQSPLLAKILDFGIAKEIDVTTSNQLATITGAITGTPQYMSPEQANARKDVDFRSDLWSLAVITFECLTGRPPFIGSTLPQLLLSIVTGSIPVPSAIRPALPREFDVWWARASSRDPAHRPQSALALAKGLRGVFQCDDDSRGVIALVDESKSLGQRARLARRAVASAGVCVALGAAAYAYHSSAAGDRASQPSASPATPAQHVPAQSPTASTSTIDRTLAPRAIQPTDAAGSRPAPAAAFATNPARAARVAPVESERNGQPDRAMPTVPGSRDSASRGEPASSSATAADPTSPTARPHRTRSRSTLPSAGRAATQIPSPPLPLDDQLGF